MPQLRFEKAPSRAALEVAFPPKCIGLVEVGFVVNQNPWSARRSRQISFGAMRAKSRPQICGKADVEPVIGCGSKNVNVEHIRSLGALARERSFCVPANAIKEFRGRRGCDVSLLTSILFSRGEAEDTTWLSEAEAGAFKLPHVERGTIPRVRLQRRAERSKDNPPARLAREGISFNIDLAMGRVRPAGGQGTGRSTGEISARAH